MTVAQRLEARPLPKLYARGFELDPSEDALGRLRDSTDLLDDVDALRHRIRADGYLYLPGCLDREEVLASRRSVTDRLAEAGMLDLAHPSEEAVAAADLALSFKPDLAHDNPVLYNLLYGGPMMSFFERFLGGPVRHYDFTWMRAVAPGFGTPPHGDVVFMGRGTHDLYTAWTPLGDVDFETGGLMVLEGSNNLDAIKEYTQRDVDTYCSNIEGEEDFALGADSYGWRWNGSISDNPVEIRRELGRRWLTSEYRAGDLLVFSTYTIHASLDNHSRRIRLSSDTRYQLASAPVDERWVGEAPVGHGPGGKRGRIC